MITASHNPEADNGVKLVEPSGEMLAPDWEAHATAVAQAATDEQLAALVLALANSSTPAPSTSDNSSSANGTDANSAPAAAATAGRATVLIGRDTRASGEGLVAACWAGVSAVGAHVMDVGVVSTPELHFCVQTYNQYHAVQEASYFTNLLESYRNLSRGASTPQQPVHVDCANGVGALKLQQMLPQLQQLGLQLVLYNTGDGRLNHLCGADYVQKEQTYPAGACLQLALELCQMHKDHE
jgi:phosphoacetylglucosamine mutase